MTLAAQHRTVCRYACWVALVAAAIFSAQVLDAQVIAHPFDVFEQQSIISANWPDGYLYEGQPTVPFYWHSSAGQLNRMGTLRAGVDTVGSDCSWGRLARALSLFRGEVEAVGCTHIIVPRFVIRQLHDSSAAVKPPSFNPYYEFTTYRFVLPYSARRGVRDADSVYRDLGNADYTKLFGRLTYLRLKIAHYSDGQAGCTYVFDHYIHPDSVRYNSDCAPTIGFKDSINTTDGDFSTTYLEAGYGIGWFQIGHDNSLQWYFVADLSAIQHATYANAGWVPGAMTAEQKRTYGTNEIGVRLRYNTWFECVGTALDIDLMANKRFVTPYQGKRSEILMTTSFRKLWGAGVGARWSTGYDYYNLAYGRTVDRRVALVILFDRRSRSERFSFTDGSP